jgi:hypothetical protein
MEHDSQGRPVGWFWCLKHASVEPYEGCPDTVRLGPYPTFAEAERALEKVAERNRAWDADETD